jgi:hypothetical protein
MKRVRKFVPVPEAFEDRTCPSLSIFYSSGNLLISGTPNTTTTPVSVNQVGGPGRNLFQVYDGSSFLGTYQALGSVTLQLNYERTDVDVNLNGGFIPGNLSIALGTGYIAANPQKAAVNVFSGTVNGGAGTVTPVAGGTVRGSVIFQNGNGQENLFVGDYQNQLSGTPIARTATPLTVRGAVNATGKAATIGQGDNLLIGGGSSVLGGLVAAQIDNITVGEAGLPTTTVSGGVSAGNSGPNPGLHLDILGTVNGNVTVNGGVPVNSLSGTSGTNKFILEATAQVNGSVSVEFGVALAGNFFELLSAPGARAAVNTGNVTFTSANGASGGPGDLYVLDGQIFGDGNTTGNLTLHLGSGTNLVQSDVGFVAGSVGIDDTGGTTVSVNGNTTIEGTSAPAFGMVINGNLTVNLGNGDNSAEIAVAPLGTFSWTSGTGNDAIVLDPDNALNGPQANSGGWHVNITLGAGDDTVNLASATFPQTIDGVINFKLAGNNTFNGPTGPAGNNWTAGPGTFTVNFLP